MLFSRSSLVTVATRLGADPWQLVQDNNLWGEDVRPGMAIRVRDTESPIRQAASRPAYRTRRVGRGENLTGIARQYGTTIVAIQNANSLGRRTVIRIGQRLRIPAR